MATVELGEVGAGVVAADDDDDRHVQFDVLYSMDQFMVVAGCRMCHVCVVRPRVRTVTSTSFLYNALPRFECKKRNKPETDTHRFQVHAVISEGKLVSFSNRAVQ